jgi:hypothetical protein
MYYTMHLNQPPACAKQHPAAVLHTTPCYILQCPGNEALALEGYNAGLRVTFRIVLIDKAKMAE